ncbi:MAG: DUF948 domain-containing protein [Trichlorobacter sp.]|jgi:uncharacterized protein YoxC|nr:DUF948 domain-containing protein [Trichlorobacter sp.]
MASITAIAALVAAIALVALVLVAIPALRSVKRAASSVADLSELLSDELKPTIRELNETLVELKTISSDVASRSGDVKKLMSALGETGDQISFINRSISNVTALFSQAGALATGARVAGSYLLDNLKRRKKGV